MKKRRKKKRGQAAKQIPRYKLKAVNMVLGNTLPTIH